MDFLRNAKKSRRKSQGFLYQEKLNLLSEKKKQKVFQLYRKKMALFTRSKKKKKTLAKSCLWGGDAKI